MLTALVIGDPHFKVSNTVDTNEMTQQMIDYAKSKTLDFIVVLGDVLDRHEHIHMIPLVKSVAFLKALQDIAPLYLIIGNHDRKNNKVYLTEEHPFTALKYWDNTTVIDTVQKVIIKDKPFTFLPYVAPGLFQQALDEVEWQDSLCLFCHQEFKGAQMGAFKSVEGDEWSEDNPYIISGHIHDYQLIQNNILYLGTPIQHSFGDNPKKKIGLFTFTTPIKNHEDLVWEKVKLNLRLKKNIHLTPKQVEGYVLDDSFDAKIIITGSLAQTKSLLKHPKIDAWRKQGTKVVFKHLPSETPKIYNHTNEPFIKLLYLSLQHDTHLLNVYSEIFG